MRWRAGGKIGVADPHGDVLGPQAELLGDDLRQHRADAGAEVLHARQHLHRAVAQHAHFAGRVGLHIGAPQRLRHADAALDRPGIGAGLVTPLPADALRADPALLAPHRARIDAVAQHQRIEAELVRQFVDRLLHGERARRVAGSAHRRTAAGVDEHVVLRGRESSGRCRAAARSCRRPAPTPTPAVPYSASEIAVSVPSRRAPMRRCCQVAGRLPVSSCSSSRSSTRRTGARGLTRQHRRHSGHKYRAATSSRSRRPSRRPSRAPG